MNRKHLVLSVFLSALLGLLAAGAATSSAARGGLPATAKHPNLLHNGSFKHWIKPTPQQKAAQGKGGPKLLSGLVPAGWQYIGQSRYGAGPIQGAVARDATVKRAGKYSLRITNGLPSDITDVDQMVPCAPNTVYRLTCYVRGRNIKPDHKDGVGAMVWLNYGPKNFWPHQTSLARHPLKYRGTFGWEKLSFTVNTGPKAAFLYVVVQLRCATGTVWYDDVKLVKEGTYTPVKSY